MKLPVYSQWGQPWSSKKLGASSVTMATDGCYVTSFTMAMNNLGYKLDPVEVVDRLNAVGGFLSNGFLTYDGVERAFPWIWWKERVYTTNDPSSNGLEKQVDASLATIKKLLLIGQPVLLAVDNLKDDGVPDHAVCCDDFKEENGRITDLHIIDPDGGKAMWFSEKYGDIWKKLYGYIAFIGPASSFPTQSTDVHKEASLVCWKISQAVKHHEKTLYSLKFGFYIKEALESFID